MGIEDIKPKTTSADEPIFIEATPDNISSDDLEKLVRHLVESFFDEPNRITEGTRLQVADVQPGLMEEVFQRRLASTKQMIADGKILACKVGDKTAAICGYDKAYDLPDGKEVYTIMTGSTAAEFEGRGFMKNLTARTFEKIRTTAPQALIYVMTRSEKIKAMQKKLPGWKEYPLTDESNPIVKAYTSTKTKEKLQREISEGYVIFVFDPANLPPPSGSASA
ncbi:hypothetical protein HYW83_00875 [Candidatus Peregrinibacteria bacterium]|nr:hypothetical protein [Candidatus Peregrinibacteria bacterium]